MSTTTTATATAPASALDTLIASPILSGLIAGVPSVADLAAAARRELATARTDAARARAEAARAASTGTAGTAPEPHEPIIRANWAPTVPTPDPAYILPPDMLTTLRGAMRAGLPVLMVGPRGTGKTEAAAAAAAAEGRPLFTLDAGPVRDASEWFGSQTLSGGRVAWQDSALVAALETEGAVVLIDEVNRASTTAGNALLPLMDARRAIRFPQRAEPVTVARGVSFILTANIGAEYTGTGAMDAALLDRCTLIETEYLPEAQELDTLRARFPSLTQARAESLVQLATRTRTPEWADLNSAPPISTRGLIQTARLAAAIEDTGADAASAMRHAVRALLSAYDGSTGSTSPRAQLAADATRLRLA